MFKSFNQGNHCLIQTPNIDAHIMTHTVATPHFEWADPKPPFSDKNEQMNPTIIDTLDVAEKVQCIKIR
jgi:hypothetical protein